MTFRRRRRVTYCEHDRELDACPYCHIAELEQENEKLREAAAEWKSRHEAVCISLRDSDHNNKDAMREAVSLATWLYDRYFLTDDSEFVLCDTTAGVISQIDNMVAGLLYDKREALESSDDNTD